MTTTTGLNVLLLQPSLTIWRSTAVRVTVVLWGLDWPFMSALALQGTTPCQAFVMLLRTGLATLWGGREVHGALTHFTHKNERGQSVTEPKGSSSR